MNEGNERNDGECGAPITVTVANGANEQEFEAHKGESVATLLGRIRETMNIPDGARILQSGNVIGDATLLTHNMRIEIQRQAGVKG